MNFIDFLNKAYKAKWNANIKSIQTDALKKTPFLKQKINNHAERVKLECDVDSICSDICNNLILASFFCVDPKKQNICEKTQIAYLKYLGLNVKKSNVRLTETQQNIKSIDVEISGIYGMLKHIDENGGAQDNQFNDLRSFILEMNKRKQEHFIVVSGGYFTQKKLDILNKSKYSMVIDLNDSYIDLVEYLHEYIENTENLDTHLTDLLAP